MQTPSRRVNALSTRIGILAVGFCRDSGLEVGTTSVPICPGSNKSPLAHARSQGTGMSKAYLHSPRGPAAINYKRVAGDVGGAVREQEQRGADHLRVSSNATERSFGVQLGNELREVSLNFRIRKRAGRDAVET